MAKQVKTLQFSDDGDRHMVGKYGCTVCFLLIESFDRRKIVEMSQASVNCWLCRKRGGLLRPRAGKALAGIVPGGKVHWVRPAGKEDWRSPCSLHFRKAQKHLIQLLPHSAVTCGHCMRFAFL